MSKRIVAMLVLALGLGSIEQASAGVVGLAADSIGTPFILDESGEVWAFKKPDDLEQPFKLPGLTHIKKIAPYLALRDDGKVLTWELDPKTRWIAATQRSAVYTKPVVVAGVDNVADIAAAEHSYVALLSNGQVIVWGRPISEPESEERTAPRVIESLSNVVSIAASHTRVAALTADNMVHDLSADSPGRLGPTQNQYTVPAPSLSSFDAKPDAKAIFLSENHTLVLDKNGGVRYWGWCNRDGKRHPEYDVRGLKDSATSVSSVTAIDDFDSYAPNAYIDQVGAVWFAYAPEPSGNASKCGEIFQDGTRAYNVPGLSVPVVAVSVHHAAGSSVAFAIGADKSLWIAPLPFPFMYPFEQFNLKNN